MPSITRLTLMLVGAVIGSGALHLPEVLFVNQYFGILCLIYVALSMVSITYIFIELQHVYNCPIYDIMYLSTKYPIWKHSYFILWWLASCIGNAAIVNLCCDVFSHNAYNNLFIMLILSFASLLSGYSTGSYVVQSLNILKIIIMLLLPLISLLVKPTLGLGDSLLGIQQDISQFSMLSHLVWAFLGLEMVVLLTKNKSEAQIATCSSAFLIALIYIIGAISCNLTGCIFDKSQYSKILSLWVPPYLTGYILFLLVFGQLCNWIEIASCMIEEKVSLVMLKHKHMVANLITYCVTSAFLIVTSSHPYAFMLLVDISCALFIVLYLCLILTYFQHKGIKTIYDLTIFSLSTSLILTSMFSLINTWMPVNLL